MMNFYALAVQALVIFSCLLTILLPDRGRAPWTPGQAFAARALGLAIIVGAVHAFAVLWRLP